MTYKVFISSAGTGSRLKAHTSFRNKGLVTLGLKPAISLIIEKFNDTDATKFYGNYKNAKKTINAKFKDFEKLKTELAE